MTEQDFNQFDDPEELNLEDTRFTCYGIKLNDDKVYLTVDNKNVKMFWNTDFGIDFNDPKQYFNLVSDLRQCGIDDFIRKHQLPENGR